MAGTENLLTYTFSKLATLTSFDAPNASFNIFYNLHTTPSRIGEVASAAGVKDLLLSHITPQTENKIPQVTELIRAQGYTGEIEAAKDLTVINLLDDDH